MPYLTLIHFNAIFLLSSFQISGSEPSTSQQQPTSQQQTESITPRRRYEVRNDRRRYTPEGSEYLSQRLRNLRRASRRSNRNLLQTLVKIAQESVRKTSINHFYLLLISWVVFSSIYFIFELLYHVHHSYFEMRLSFEAHYTSKTQIWGTSKM